MYNLFHINGLSLNRKWIATFLVLLIATASVPIPAANRVDFLPTLPGDTIRTRGTPSTLDFYLENDATLTGFGLGFKIWSPDGATWLWTDVGGYGGFVTVAPGCRMDPPEAVWDQTGLVVYANVFNYIVDSVYIGGHAFSGGMPAGPLEHMYSCHFEAGGDGGDDSWVGTLCFDSCFFPPGGDFVFTDAGGSYAPVIGWAPGGSCYPVSSPGHCHVSWTTYDPTMYIDNCESGMINLETSNPELLDIMFNLESVTGGAGSASIVDYGNGTMDLHYTAHPSDVGQTIDIKISANCTNYPLGYGIDNNVSVIVTGEPPTLQAGLWHNAVGINNTVVKTDIVGTDLDQCDNLEYSIVSGPGDIDPVTGIYTWTPTIDDVGVHFTHVSASDGSVAAIDSFYLGIIDVESFPGNANCNDAVDVGDAVYLVNYIFQGGAAPLIANWADPNADCTINVGDIVFLIAYIFNMGSAPQPGCVN